MPARAFRRWLASGDLLNSRKGLQRTLKKTADFFSRVPVEIVGDARNVTHVRKAIPLVQPCETVSRLLIRGLKISAGLGFGKSKQIELATNKLR